MKIILSVFLFVSFSNINFAQYLPGAKQISLSNSDIALSNDVFSLFNNPAGLSQMNWREVGLYYSPAPFGISELANGFIAYHEPTDFGSFAIGGMTYGFELYKESKITLGYSNDFENKFFAGITINYHSFSINNYGSDGAVYFDLGGLAYITNYLRWGISASNINRATISEQKNQLPVIFRSGFSYDPVSYLSINAAVEKDLEFDPSFLFGIDYRIIQYISFRTGFSTEPSRYSVGVGINYSFINLDYALFTHNDLGLTHQAGLIISFGEEGERNEKIKRNLNLIED